MFAPFLISLTALLGPHDSAVLPNDFEIVHVFQNVSIPVGMRFDPDGYLYIADRIGRVFASEPPFDEMSQVIDLSDEVNNSGDRGLLGLALHPGFVADGGPTSWMYLLYTSAPTFGVDTAWNENDEYSWMTLVRYQVSGASEHGVEADLSSRQVLLGERLPDGSVPDGIASLHSSHGPGTLAFGADGMLLVTAGDGAHYDFTDGGGQDDPGFDDWTHPVTGLVGPHPANQDCGAFRAQSLEALSGKLLRLDPETGLGLPSNPFFDGDLTSNASKIFGLGFRNPFRLEVEPGTGDADPSLGNPGRLWIGDVGQVAYEELDRVDAPGLNFGWPCFEGPFPNAAHQDISPLASNPHACPDCTTAPAGVVTPPVLAWRREGPDQVLPAGIHFDIDGNPIPGFVGSCSTGGAFYTAGGYPSLYDNSLFFADFGSDEIRRAEIAPDGSLVAVHAFAHAMNAVVDIERDPISGDLFLAQLAGDGSPAEISRLVFKLGIPEARLELAPLAGLAPLDVTLDASGSIDPTGQPLEFTFEFADGSPPLVTTRDSVQHTYTGDGTYLVSVTVGDPGGLEDTDQALVVVGALPPQVTILDPVSHIEPHLPGTLALEGLGLDPAGPELPLSWSIDLHHNSHVHPASLTAAGPSAAVQLDAHGDSDDLFYFRAELLGTTGTGLEARDSAWVFPAGQTQDMAETLGAIARVVEDGLTLDPTGVTNPDLEVVRDAVLPDALTPDPQTWFSTATLEPAAAEEWFGIEYRNEATLYSAFIEATWTLGEVTPAGGALIDPRVETLLDGAWQPVSGLVIEPPYPTAGVDPVSFSSFRFRFDPAGGDALRVIGAPSGTVGYATVAELRARALTTAALIFQSTDATPAGTPIARVLEAGDDLTAGPANPDPATLTNGTFGVLGSTSFWPTFDSFASVPLTEDDWFGIEWDVPQTIDRVAFQLGLAHDGGGRLEQLHVEWRGAPTGPWQQVVQQVIKPPYLPASSLDYAEHAAVFEPVAASAVRLIGTPADAAAFGAFSELRMGGPPLEPGCGVEPYGIGQGDLGLTLSSATSPLPGFPMALRVTGATQAGAGALVYAQAPGLLTLLDGHLLLVDPATYKIIPIAFNAAGEAWFNFTWPTTPGAFSNGLYVQAAAADPASIDGTDFSAGLELRPCEPEPNP